MRDAYGEYGAVPSGLFAGLVGYQLSFLKLKICVLTRPQRLRSHSYSRTRLERSPSTVKFTLSGFRSVTAASP